MIQFENIRSGEVVKFSATQDAAARTAQIAAYLNSSNMSPNALKGQDFGWRLAPEIVDEIERIKTDLPTLDGISRRVGVPIDELRDFHILNYIVEQTFQQEAMEARKNGNNLDERARQEDYEARVKAAREKREAATYKEEAPVAPFAANGQHEVAEQTLNVAMPAEQTQPEPAPETPITQVTDAPTVDADELDLPGIEDAPADTTVKVENGEMTVPETDGTTELSKPADTTSAE